MKRAKRTTHRSSKGTKLYAVRQKDGKFKDIQTYKRAHGGDVHRHAMKEVVKRLRDLEKRVSRLEYRQP